MAVTYNQETKRFKVEGEVKAKKSVESRVLVPVGGQTLDKLTSFAQADGFVFTRKDKAGKLVDDRYRMAQAIRMYVSQAVTEFIGARESK